MDWYNPWTYGIDVPEIMPLELLNWAIPNLAPNQRDEVARYLYSQRTADPWITQQIGEGYNRPSGSPDTTRQWLSQITGLQSTPMPSHLQESPEGDWFRGLLGMASDLNPDMTRQQQSTWNSNLERWLGQAPNDAMRGVGGALFTPTLTQPEYGSVPLAAKYTVPYQTKGGLVSNPWFT